MGTSSSFSTVTVSTTPTTTVISTPTVPLPDAVPAQVPAAAPQMRSINTPAEPRGKKRQREGGEFDAVEISEPDWKIARHETAEERQVHALFTAIDRGDDKEVAVLLEQSPELGRAFYPGLHDTTPLCQAARRGHTKIVGLLLELGVPVDEPGRNGSTPLMFAAQQGHVESIQLLCLCGADPNCLNEKALRPPLVFAIESGNLAASQALIALGADPQREVTWVDKNSGERKTQSPLTTALRMDFAELIAWLLDTGRVTLGSRDPVTKGDLLFAAILHGAASVVGMVAMRGADLNRKATFSGGRTFNGASQVADAAMQFHVVESILRYLKISKNDELLKLVGQLNQVVSIDLLLHVDLWINPKGHAADGLRDPVLRSQPEKLLERMAACGFIYKDSEQHLEWHAECGWLACLRLSKNLISRSVACAPILSSNAFSRPSSAKTAPENSRPTTAQLLQMLVEIASMSTSVHTPFSARKLSAQTEQVMNRMFELQLQLLLSAIRYHRSEFDRHMRTLPDICINTFISLSHRLNEPDLYRMLTKEWGLYDPVARAVIRLVGEAYNRLRSLSPQQLPATFATMPPAEQLRQVMIDLLDEWDKIPEIVEALGKAGSTDDLELLGDLLFQQWRLFADAFGVTKPRYSPFGPHRPEVVDSVPQMEIDGDDVPGAPEAPVSLNPQ